MSLPVYVDAYSGYRVHERPTRFELDGVTYEIDAVEDRWYSPSALYFKVRCGQNRYILRYSGSLDEWTLQSAYDGAALFSRSHIDLVVVDEATLRRAEQAIDGCEGCNPGGAETPFDWILDEVSGRSSEKTDYFLPRSAVCPQCRRKVTEKTHVEPR